MKRYHLFVNERGSSLVITLFVLVLISIMGLGLLTVAANTMKNTTNERQDQAVYYIAEAGLVERRAYLYNQVKVIYNNLKTVYNKIEDPEGKIKFDFDKTFNDQVNQIILASNTLKSDEGNYKTHFNEKTESYAWIDNVSIDNVSNGSSIKFKITSEGKIGDTRSRRVSQIIDVSIDNVKKTEDISTGNNKPPSKLNACYALFTYGGMDASGGGNFTGDIYSKEIINITGSPKIDGKIFTTKDIIITGTPKQVRGLYSEKDITVSGGTTIDGNISANGNLTSPNATINGNILIGGNLQSSASIGGNIKANGNITIDNGTIKKDIFSNKDITLNGGTIHGDVISKQNISVPKYPGFSDRGLHAIAKNNIHIKEWITPKQTIYSGTLKLDQNTGYTSHPVSEVKVNSVIQEYEQKIIDALNQNSNYGNSNLSDLTNHVKIQNDCISTLPTLDNVDTIFAPAPPKQPVTSTVSIPSHYTGEYIVESTEDTRIDEIDLYPDSNNRINQLNISLNKPNGILDVSKARLQSKSTLTLKLSSNNSLYINDLTMLDGSRMIFDLNGGNHSLYVDSLASAGDIKLVNAGSLKFS